MSQQELIQQLAALNAALRSQPPAPAPAAAVPPELLQQWMASQVQARQATPPTTSAANDNAPEAVASEPTTADAVTADALNELAQRFGKILQQMFDGLSATLAQIERRLSTLEAPPQSAVTSPEVASSLSQVTNQEPNEPDITSTNNEVCNPARHLKKKRKKGKP